MHLADTFIQSNLQCIQAIHYCIIMCVPWELNPQPFALQTQCSTAEAREHMSCDTEDWSKLTLITEINYILKYITI